MLFFWGANYPLEKKVWGKFSLKFLSRLSKACRAETCITILSNHSVVEKTKKSFVSDFPDLKKQTVEIFLNKRMILYGIKASQNDNWESRKSDSCRNLKLQAVSKFGFYLSRKHTSSLFLYNELKFSKSSQTMKINQSTLFKI
jgi:hypothetical protein